MIVMSCPAVTSGTLVKRKKQSLKEYNMLPLCREKRNLRIFMYFSFMPKRNSGRINNKLRRVIAYRGWVGQGGRNGRVGKGSLGEGKVRLLPVYLCV